MERISAVQYIRLTLDEKQAADDSGKATPGEMDKLIALVKLSAPVRESSRPRISSRRRAG